MDSDTKKRSLQQFQQSLYYQDTQNSQEIEKKNFKNKNLQNIDFFLQGNNKNENSGENEKEDKKEQTQQLEQKHEEKKGNAPKRSLILGLFTCKGFDNEIFLPLVQSGVNVKIICNKEKEHDKDSFIETNYKGFQNWTLIYKQVNFGCFHPKLWILKFPNFIRIVIGSGNLQIPHWTHWNNVLWFKDFYLLSKSNPQKAQEFQQKIEESKNNSAQRQDNNLEFKQILFDFLFEILPYRYKKYQDFLELDLDNYLFEDINIKLVPSMRGKFIQNQENKYGFQRVKQILIENPPVQFYKNPIVTAMSSSVGNLNEQIIEDILSYLLPFNFHSQEELKIRRQKNIQKSIEALRKQFQFIFPSKNYIEKETYEGVSYSDCLFFSKKIYFSENFAIQTMMDYLPTPGNEGSYPHLKCFIITDEDKKITDDTVIYFGSHNFTSNAFGKFDSELQQLYIANIELGFIFPPQIGSQEMKQNIINNLPFQFPTYQYEKNDRPFIADLDYPLV